MYKNDDDGSRVLTAKTVISTTTTTIKIGGYYEWVRSSNWTKYFFAGSTRIAVRENGTLTWLISDHLGSTSLTVDAGGNLVSNVKYTAFSFSLTASECFAGGLRLVIFQAMNTG